MRPTVKDRIAVFNPQGFLDGNNTPVFLTVDDIRATEQLSVDMVLVSLKKVIFFNKNGLDVFVKLLNNLRAKMRVSIGFCDYDHQKFQAIVKFYEKDLNFSLFKTQKIASLFASNNQEETHTVLIYNEDPSQRSTMAIELFDFGHNPVIAQSKKEFEEKKQHQEAYYAVVEDTFLGLFGQKIATRVSGNAIIYTISNYLDATIADVFNLDYHTNSLNVGFRLFVFDAYKVVAMNIHALNFFSRLSSSATEYNATLCFVGLTLEKTPLQFKEDLEDSGILFFDHMDDILKNKELLEELGASSAAMTKHKRVLTKTLVGELPRFIEATVSTIEMMTSATANKEAANIHQLDVEDTQDKVASSIGFYGDMDGMIVLIFPKEIARKTCELLLGEAEHDIDAILDALAEFVNIIGGRVKSLLSEKGVALSITLPRTYLKVDDLLEMMQNKKGVQVDLNFAGDKFVFFLTR